MRKKFKLFAIIFLITLVLFWTLYCLSYNYEWARAVCAVVLFPFAPFWMVFEHYCALYDEAFILPINDEITGIFLFLLSVIGQTVVNYNIYINCYDFFKILKEKK